MYNNKWKEAVFLWHNPPFSEHCLNGVIVDNLQIFVTVAYVFVTWVRINPLVILHGEISTNS